MHVNFTFACEGSTSRGKSQHEMIKAMTAVRCCAVLAHISDPLPYSNLA